jgi:aryl-alcohol dehydrogenase-like predicted oxidoreductase
MEENMKTSLPTRAFGQTGMAITRLGVGAWAMGGNMWGPQDDADSDAAIRHAIDLGINWIDTAAAYGVGHSEEVIGRTLKALPGDRRPFVFTKGGVIRDANGQNPRRLANRESLRKELESFAACRSRRSTSTRCTGRPMTCRSRIIGRRCWS